MENVVTVEINLPSWFGFDMVKGFFKTNFTQLLFYSFYNKIYANEYRWITFSKENIMDYTNLLLTMNDLKKEKTLQEDLFYFQTVNI